MSSIKSHLHAANVMLFAYVLVSNMALMLYEFSGRDLTNFDLITRIALLYVLGYWLQSDSRRRNYDLPYCPGAIFVATGAIYLPYYLFKTRGRFAFVTIAIYLTFYIASSLLGVAVAALVFGAQ